MGLGFAGSVSLACDSQADIGLPPSSSAVESGIWISRDEIRARPMTGPGWAALVDHAHRRIGRPDLSDQDSPTNIRVLAKAIYFARTGDERFAREVADACRRVQGTERYADTLAIGRELIAFVIAADLIGLDGDERARFEKWLRQLRERDFRGRTIRSTHEDRPNNWGTHAGATRIAVAAYLGDRREIARAAYVFRGWTGERDAWQRFEYGAPWWQVPGAELIPVNPRNATREGHPIGGVLPDDQRRAGRFRWPPAKENYVYEALQGAVTQAVLLERQGYEPWAWGDRALLRAFEWLHTHAGFPAEGDDTWLPHLVNRAYGSDFPAPVPSQPGKGIGFSEWTHGPTPARPIAADARTP